MTRSVEPEAIPTACLTLKRSVPRPAALNIKPYMVQRVFSVTEGFRRLERFTTEMARIGTPNPYTPGAWRTTDEAQE